MGREDESSNGKGDDAWVANRSYSEQLGKWIELGNSGMFRPEMLRPMGLPEGVNVIAWGLGLERCAVSSESLARSPPRCLRSVCCYIA